MVLLGMPLAVVFGFRLERVLITRLYERHDLHQVLLTYGLILVLDECRSLVWGNDVHSVAVPALFDCSIPLTENLSYPVYRLCGLGLLPLDRSGDVPGDPKNQARHDDPRRRRQPGNDPRARRRCPARARLRLCFRCRLGSITFVVVVIGGIGSLRGAMAAALLIGLADTIGKVLLPQIAGMAVYLLMGLVLLLRPAGPSAEPRRCETLHPLFAFCWCSSSPGSRWCRWSPAPSICNC